MVTGLARLHVITPADSPDRVLGTVDQALCGGAPLVQLRVKGVEDRWWWQLAEEAARRCHRVGATCVVNDRADIAAAAGADGVHLGDHDLPVAEVRSVFGPAAVVGATCRSAEAARRAEDEGATYLGVGPAYTTFTKAGLPGPIGPEGVAEVVAAVGLPVIAIGGVTIARVGALLEAGAYGVAVCAAVFGAADPRAATAELAAAIEAREWSSP